MAMRSPQRRADYYREFFTMKGICKIHTYIHTHQCLVHSTGVFCDPDFPHTSWLQFGRDCGN